MATYINNNVKFHGFSKSPVSPDTTLGGAVNPSGHTITTSQVRAQDIPAFLNTFQGTRAQAITWLGKNYTTPAHNDIVYYGGEFKAGFDTPKCLKYNGKTSTWEDFDITKATTLKNADDKDVIAVHQNCSTVFVDGGNNAATNSNRWSLFVKKSDNTILDHFVASTDKIVAGMPSLGYNALVLWNGAAIDEGELDANYVGNTFAGIIHLNKQYNNGDDAKFKVTCFEYIGEKLTASLEDLAKKVESVTVTAGEGVQAVTDTATAAGLSVSTKTITVEGQSEPVTVKALDIDVAEVSAQGVVTSGDGAKLVTATGAQNIATKVANDAITAAVADGSVIDTRIDEVISAATLADGQKIATTTDTTKLVNVEDVKTYVSENAKVTITQGTGITVTPNGQASTSFTVAVDNTVATKKSVDDLSQTVTALSETVSSNKTDLEGKITTAQTTLQSNIDGVSGRVTTLETVTVPGIDTRLQSAEATIESLTTGDTSVDSKVEAAKTELQGKIDEINTSLTTGAIHTEIDGVRQTANAAKAKADTAVQTVSKSGSSTLLTVTQTGTAVTVGLSDTVATKTDAANAASSAITTSLGGTTTGTIGGAISSAVSGLETKLTTGEGSLGAKVTALESSVNTITGTTIPNAITTAKNDAVTTVKALGLSATDSDDAGKVTVTLGGTVETPTITVTSSDIASAQSLTALETKVNNFHKAGVSYVVADTLPTIASGTEATYNGKVYLVNTGLNGAVAADGSRIEYMYVNKGSEESPSWGWEKIGTTTADLNGYVKSIATANGVSGVVNGNEATITVQDGTTAQKGIVQLASTHDASDTTKAATGATVAAAISGIASTSQSDNGVKVTTKGGSVTGVEVTTTSIVSGGSLVQSVSGDNLITAADALAAVKLAKPDNYVASVTGYNTSGSQVTSTQGAAIKVLDGRGTTVTANDLWGTTVNVADGVITVDHKFLSNPNGTNAWNSSVKSVKDNKAYTSTDASGQPLCNIQTERIEDGSYMFSYTSLESFSGDLSSLTNGDSMFLNTTLASFSGDLSSLVNGGEMFQGTKLTSFSGDLSSLVNGSYMFGYTSLTSFSGDLRSLVNGKEMFYSTNLASFSSDLSSLTNGSHMFQKTKLTSFNSDLSSLTNGTYMFYGCNALTSFNSDLSSLVNGSYMFHEVSLTSFNSDLSSLTNGYYMFYKTALASFSEDLSSLVDGGCMFYETSLTSFSGDLSSLTNGYYMFGDCTKLETFIGDLSSLTDGLGMFSKTKLNTESVECIADTINTVSSGRIDIGIANSTPNEAENAAFWTMKNEKGWNVYVNGNQYNPTQPTAIATLNENGEEVTAPIPFWAKPVETDEEHAQYVGEDGKFYNVVGGQFIYVSDPETYGQFASLADAVANMRLTKYERPQETEEA